MNAALGMFSELTEADPRNSRTYYQFYKIGGASQTTRKAGNGAN